MSKRRREVDVTTIAGRDGSHNGWLASQIQRREDDPYDAAWMAEAAEWITERSDVWVRVFLTGCPAWDNITRTCCPVCKNLPKPPGWYCGRCDRPKGSGARLVRVKAVDKAACGLKVQTRREKRKGRKAA